MLKPIFDYAKQLFALTNEKHEREKLALQWKHDLSLLERRLPPKSGD